MKGHERNPLKIPESHSIAILRECLEFFQADHVVFLPALIILKGTKITLLGGPCSLKKWLHRLISEETNICVPDSDCSLRRAKRNGERARESKM